MTYRTQADECCASCRELPGIGPWCPRCGAELRNATTHDDWFADDQCATCDEGK